MSESNLPIGHQTVRNVTGIALSIAVCAVTGTFMFFIARSSKMHNDAMFAQNRAERQADIRTALAMEGPRSGYQFDTDCRWTSTLGQRSASGSTLVAPNEQGKAEALQFASAYMDVLAKLQELDPQVK